MRRLNKVTLIGNLGKDTELIQLETNVRVAKFSVATTEIYKDGKGKKDRYANLPESALHILRSYYKALNRLNIYLKASMAAVTASGAYKKYLKIR